MYVALLQRNLAGNLSMVLRNVECGNMWCVKVKNTRTVFLLLLKSYCKQWKKCNLWQEFQSFGVAKLPIYIYICRTLHFLQILVFWKTLWLLTLSCIMLWNGQSVHTARRLKYVWPFYNIIHDRVKSKIYSKWILMSTQIWYISKRLFCALAPCTNLVLKAVQIAARQYLCGVFSPKPNYIWSFHAF